MTVTSTEAGSEPIFVPIETCGLCHKILAEKSGGSCPQCNSVPLDRAFLALLREMLREYDPATAPTPVIVLPLRISSRTRTAIEKFGKCLPPLTSGWADIVDPKVLARVVTLSEAGNASVDVVFAPPLSLDFVVEFEAALTSAARVLRPAGVLVLGLNVGRVVSSDSPPVAKYKVDPASKNLPPETELYSVEVGRGWLLTKLRSLGLTASVVVLHDRASDTKIEFFLGQRVVA